MIFWRTELLIGYGLLPPALTASLILSEVSHPGSVVAVLAHVLTLTLAHALLPLLVLLFLRLLLHMLSCSYSLAHTLYAAPDLDVCFAARLATVAVVPVDNATSAAAKGAPRGFCTLGVWCCNKLGFGGFMYRCGATRT